MKNIKNIKRVDWGYYDKFKDVANKYLPDCGEGETMATQIVTAVNKLVYKWYNDGDYYDNSQTGTEFCNDISSYANWLAENVKGCKKILQRIWAVGYIPHFCYDDDARYEHILKDLADLTLNENYLSEYNNEKSVGSIYDCEGDFKLEYEEDDDDWY